MKFLIQIISIALTLVFSIIANAALNQTDRAEFTFKNLLAEKNPGFESSTAGWTASGGTLSVASSGTNFMGIGLANATWDASASAQTLTSPSITIPSGYAGTNGLYRCKVMNLSGATTTMSTWDGTTAANSITIDPGTTAKYVEIAAPFGAAATTTAIRFTSVASNEPLISIDDCYIGPNFNLSSTNPNTDWTAYTPTFVGFGTVTSINVEWRRSGGDLQIRGNFTMGTPTSTTASMTLPSNFTIGGSVTTIHACGRGEQDSTATGSNKAFIALCTQGQNTINFSIDGNGVAFSPIVAQTGTTVALSGVKASFQQFSVPISGWAANSAVRADNSDYDWTAYTPTFTGFGTVSIANANDCMHARIGPDLHIRCKFTSGTMTATEARISLPNNLTSDSSKVPALQLAGPPIIRNVASTSFALPLIESNVGYLTIGTSDGSGTQLAKQNGTQFGNGQVWSVSAKIPISGWTVNQRTPLLVGSVTSSTTGIERVERASLTSTSCTSTPCTLASNTPAISSISRASTGNFSINFTAGSFSAAPVCTITTQSTTAAKIATNPTSSTSSYTFQIYTVASSPALADDSFQVICMGPR